jgi:hypothetical protein
VLLDIVLSVNSAVCVCALHRQIVSPVTIRARKIGVNYMITQRQHTQCSGLHFAFSGMQLLLLTPHYMSSLVHLVHLASSLAQVWVNLTTVIVSTLCVHCA